ncbi:hypothetical protein B0I35DRAFT_412072 [Stachybotrys elegans]|uniref:Uncharacterized protein n=1 Tax=Stachybotrys elegans TaxID=80388 RepID=A0A8K0SPJ7_9HYPO|nr:hypothetical protein B0I35DRAFT_412072 [Stachybotrys elegans]
MDSDTFHEQTECIERYMIEQELPKEWAINDEAPGEVDRVIKDWPTVVEHLSQEGLPVYQPMVGRGGKPHEHSQQYISLRNRLNPEFTDRMDIPLILMTRDIAPGQTPARGQWESSVRRDKKTVYVQFCKAPKDRVDEYIAQGWVFYQRKPGPRLAKEGQGFRDTRPKLPPTQDVVTTDKPAEDTDRHLGVGNSLLASTWAKDWKPGNLLGENGSNYFVKARSMTYCAPEHRGEVIDDRLATSAGHIQAPERPAYAGLGWGGHDQWNAWTGAGRAIPKEMVEKKDWSTDPMAPAKCYNEKGEFLGTWPALLPEDQLPKRREPPVPLYDVLHGVDKEKKAKERRKRQYEMSW